MCIRKKAKVANKNSGANLVELMIAVAIAAIFIVPMLGLLYSMQGANVLAATTTPTWVDKFLLVDDAGKAAFNLKDVSGKKSCRNFKWQGASVTEPVFPDGESLSQKMGTSSLPTAISALGKYLIFGANSASTTDPDLLVVKKTANNGNNFSVVSTLDIGPGIADIFISGRTAYFADTGVKDQAKAVDLSDLEHPVVGRAFVFPGSNSVTSPISKRLIAYGPLLIIGTEKSSLPEIEAFNINTGAMVGSINTEFGINRLFATGDKLVVLGPVDPEVNVYNLLGRDADTGEYQKINSHDAPGGSGNGRSIDMVGDRIIFGRTKGGNELNVLASVAEIQQALQSQKISASIDNIIADINQVLVFTSDPLRELIVFEPSKDKYGNIETLTKVAEFNLPARTADAVCDGNKLYVALQSPAVPLVVIAPII